MKKYAESLANQTYLKKMKIIIIDNKSTDDSLEKMKKYVRQYRLPAEIICHEKNMGLMYSMMEGYRKIDTKYFTVQHPDDYYISPEELKRLLYFFLSK